MVLNDKKISHLANTVGMITPFEKQLISHVNNRKVISYGLSSYGYDIRLSEKDFRIFKAQDKKMIKKAVGMHDKQQHGGKKTNLTTLKNGGMAMKKMAGGGLSAGHKDANGVAKKGLTKGKMVKMNMGGRAC
jgi:hypothetical protein